jgi:hypothetical protein
MKHLTPCQAIHSYCIKCMGDNLKLVKGCENRDCDLWLFRMGKNPNYKGLGRRKKDPHTGQFLKTEKVLNIDEAVLSGDYRIVRIVHGKTEKKSQ